MPPTETEPFQAPYYLHENCRVPGGYIIAFRHGHTIEKHFACLGHEFEVTSLDNGYCAVLDDQLFNALRYDPGVKLVENNVFVTLD